MKKSILIIILLLTLLPSVFAINLLDDFNNLFNNDNSNLITGNAVSLFSNIFSIKKCTPGPACQGNNAGTINKNCKFIKGQTCRFGTKCSDGNCVPKKECNPQMICMGNNIIFQDSKCDTCGASAQYCANGCKDGVCNPAISSGGGGGSSTTNPSSNPYGNGCVAGWTCDGNNYRYQHGDCSFEQDYYPCTFGCSNGQCNSDPNKNTAGCGNIGACRDGKPGFILNDCTFQPSATSWCTNGCNSQGTGCGCADNTYCILDSNSQTVSVEHTNSDCTNTIEHCANGCSFSGTQGNPHCAQETTCTPGWICQGTNVVFQTGDCSGISFGMNCQNGCTNGQCNPPKPPCDVGPVCLNDNTIGYQGADCNICGKSTCKYGCENGKCKTETPLPYPVPSVPSTTATGSPGCKIGKPYCDGNNIVEESLVNGVCKKQVINSCTNKCSILTNTCNPSTTVPGGIAVPGRKIIKAY